MRVVFGAGAAATVAISFFNLSVAWVFFAALCVVAVFEILFASPPSKALSDQDREKVRIARLARHEAREHLQQQQPPPSRSGFFVPRNLLFVVVLLCVCAVLIRNSWTKDDDGPKSAPVSSLNKANWSFIKSNWLQLQTEHHTMMKISSDYDEHGEGVARKLSDSGSFDRCAFTADMLKSLFCGHDQNERGSLDENGIAVFMQFLNQKKREIVWEISIWQGSDRPTHVEDDHGALGHVFIVHQFKNSSFDMYQSYIKQYNLGEHMTWIEDHPGRPMTPRTVVKHLINNLRTLIDATEWDDKANNAYLDLFHVNVMQSVSGMLEASTIQSKRFHVFVTPVCIK